MSWNTLDSGVLMPLSVYSLKFFDSKFTMSVPQVAIVGRPNVGKSSVFNWLANKRLAIVDDYAGVTRDRVTTLIECDDERYFELVDTGGMGIEDVDNLTADVKAQIDEAIDSADVILFVVDVRSGLLPLDEEAAERLRAVDVPVILVANKADHDGLDVNSHEFHKLGRGHIINISTLQNRNRQELISLILERLPQNTTEVDTPQMKVAIVGRRNVGKSTFINTLAKAKRMIVSEVAGTTRDSVDVAFELDGQHFMAIDTPGLRRRRAVRTDLEFYSLHRAQRSVRRADVVLMFFDATEKTSKVDKQLVGYITEHHKPVVFVVNKWDKLQGEIPTEKWVQYLHAQFPTMQYAPIAFITGQTGKNCKALLNHAQMLFKQARERVSTGQLNRLMHAAFQRNPPPLHQGRRPKIFYATQVGTEPPTIVIMCNDPDGFANHYRRYLLGVLRDYLPFGEVPIKLFFEKKSQHEGDSRSRRNGDAVADNDADDDDDVVIDEDAVAEFDE